MYERITIRHPHPYEDFITINETKQLPDTEQSRKVLNRLCEIEDKICEGRMVELPCAAGTSVWFATCVCDEIGKEKYDALEGEVISFSMQKDGLWVYCRYKCGLTYWHTIDGFKAEVFLTPEEANKKLKELENEQQ